MFKRALPAFALLFVSISVHAYSYRWEGTVDYGSGTGQLASGSFTISNRILTKLDLAVGGSLYTFAGEMFQPSYRRELLTDVPMMTDDQPGASQGLQWWTSGWNLQSFFKDADSEEMGGRVTWLQRDAAPTPEPSSFVLMGTALAGLVGFRAKRRKAQR